MTWGPINVAAVNLQLEAQAPPLGSSKIGAVGINEQIRMHTQKFRTCQMTTRRQALGLSMRGRDVSYLNLDMYYRRHHEGDSIAEPVTTPVPTDIVESSDEGPEIFRLLLTLMKGLLTNKAGIHG